MPRTKPGHTVIRISKKTARALKKKAIAKYETYNEIINRLLDQK